MARKYAVSTTKAIQAVNKNADAILLNPKKKPSNKKVEKKKAEAILKFASLFVYEFIKMMKNSQILVNPPQKKT